MGLKAVHIAFIGFCVAFLWATGLIAVKEFLSSGRWSLLLIGVVCFVSGVVLIPYAKRFLQKLKNIGYM